MSQDETEKDDPEAGHKDDNQPPETMEQQARRRITGAVAGEIRTLEVYASRARRTRDTASFVQTMEAIASIKAKAEVYCLQIEMAVKTATMATTLGAIMKERGAQGVEQQGPDMSAVKDLASRASRPGLLRDEPADSGGDDD